MSTTTYPRTDPAGKPWPAYMGKKDFAQRVLTRSPSYVTQLGDAGRLVLHPNGKWVDVQASLDRIEATTSPDKQAVADRHASARAANTATPAASPQTASSGQAQAAEEDVGKTFHASKAVKEKYLALAARRDYEKSIGLLIDAHEAYYHMANVMTTCRAALERIPTQLAPQLVGIHDDGQIKQMLFEYIESVLENMSHELQNINKI